MKTKSIKKLQLSKKAIAKLDGLASSGIKGGFDKSRWVCNSHSICPPGQHCY